MSTLALSDEPQLTTYSSVTSDGEEYLIRNIISQQKEEEDDDERADDTSIEARSSSDLESI